MLGIRQQAGSDGADDSDVFSRRDQLPLETVISVVLCLLAVPLKAAQSMSRKISLSPEQSKEQQVGYG